MCHLKADADRIWFLCSTAINDDENILCTHLVCLLFCRSSSSSPASPLLPMLDKIDKTPFHQAQGKRQLEPCPPRTESCPRQAPVVMTAQKREQEGGTRHRTYLQIKHETMPRRTLYQAEQCSLWCIVIDQTSLTDCPVLNA